jgi:hypothetical protein
VESLRDVAIALDRNSSDVEEAEARLQALHRLRARLHCAGLLLEQQRVLDALQLGADLGYDAGRPVAALLAFRCEV